MKFWNYNSKWNSWLFWKGEWVEILYNSNPITFGSVFTNIKLKNNKTNEDYNNLKDAIKDYECEINYSQLYSWYLDKIKYLKEYFQAQSFSFKSTNNRKQIKKNRRITSEEAITKIDSIMNKFKELKERDTKVLQVTMTQIMEFKKQNLNYYIYSLKIILSKTIINKANDISNGRSANNLSDSISNYSNINEFQDYFCSNNSKRIKNSMIGETHTTKSSDNKNKIHVFSNTENKDKSIDVMSKSFSFFSILILLLNSGIILLCIVFLVIQIININRLLTVNSLYFMFKRIRWTFGNTFIALFPNYCVAKEDSDTCNNPYEEYTTKVIQINNYDSKDRFEKFIQSELKVKNDILYERFNEYKPKLYEYGDQTWIDTLFETMIYININKNNGVFGQSSEIITWDEGIRRYIASIYIWLNSAISFGSFPYYIITVQNKTVDFEKLRTKSLSEVELHIYLLIINFLNYSSVFSNAENSLTKKFDLDKNFNRNILIIYIVTISLFNIILFCLCFWQLMIVKRLFCRYILQFLTSMNNPKFILFYSKKFEYLIEWTTLYSKNPTLIMKTWKDEETLLIKDEFKKKSQTKTHISSDDETLSEEPNTFRENHSQTENTLKKDIHNKLFPFNMWIMFIFALTLIFLFIFSILIFVKFASVNKIVAFIRGKWLIENSMYSNILLIHTIVLLNTTEDEITSIWGVNNTSVDGYLNKRLRDLNILTLEMFNIQNQIDEFAVSFGVFENITCTELILLIQDDVLKQSNLPLGYNFEQVRVKECERYGIAKLRELKFLFYDINYRISQVWNSLNGNSYETWYNFTYNWEYNEWIHLGLFLWRPIATYIRRAFLENSLNWKFLEYQNLLIFFWGFNILLEIWIFIVIKFGVVGRWTKIYNDLKIMDSCFNLR